MEKFKVGDKVRCIDSRGAYCITKGEDYFVEGIDNYGNLIVRGSIASWNPNRFELVEEKQEEEAMSEITNKFKVGDKVRCVDFTNAPSLTRGMFYTVQGVNKNNFIKVGLWSFYWNPDRFELVEEEELEEVNTTGFKKFGEMTLEEKEELISAYLRGEEILYLTLKTGVAKVETYESTRKVVFLNNYSYKLEKQELDIPWEYIDGRFNYAVMESDCSVLVLSHKPKYKSSTGRWIVSEGYVKYLPEPLNIKNLDKIKPEESLVERPRDE